MADVKQACDDAAGRVVPVIDRNRCKDEELCVRVCPYEVFEIRALGTEERRRLSWFGKFKALSVGYRQAFAVRAAACHNCGLCVDACPEDAIRLAPAADA